MSTISKEAQEAARKWLPHTEIHSDLENPNADYALRELTAAEEQIQAAIDQATAALVAKWQNQYALTCREIECVEQLIPALESLVDSVNIEFGDGRSDIGGKTGPALIHSVNTLAEVNKNRQGPVSERLLAWRKLVAERDEAKRLMKVAQAANAEIMAGMSSQLKEAEAERDMLKRACSDRACERDAAKAEIVELRKDLAWIACAGLNTDNPDDRVYPSDIRERANKAIIRTAESYAHLTTIDREKLAELDKFKTRMEWLHRGGWLDAGYDWGIFKVAWINGRAAEVWETRSDFSDLDAAMQREANEQPKAQP